MMVIFICFDVYSYVIMARPKKTDPKKVRLSVTIHPSLVEWIQENSGSIVENKPFRSVSDLIEQAIILLKEKMESKK
jgi:hypothetical protein